MKLYAGFTEETYEYAIWARSYKHIAEFFGWDLAEAKRWFRDQSHNKALKALCPDKTKLYRSPVGIDAPEADWQPYRTVTP